MRLHMRPLDEAVNYEMRPLLYNPLGHNMNFRGL